MLGRVSNAGYRVIAPDQVGFCKSTKPAHYVFTFQQLAANTHALLASLGVGRVTTVAHSTGGMLGIHYALMYPSDVDRLAMISPIGLEDWKEKGVPWLSLDQWCAQELGITAAGVRAYEAKTYYSDAVWTPEYEKWVQMYAGMFVGPGKKIVALNSAQLYDIVYTQPVFYEFEKVRVPVLLVIGDKDTTALGKAAAKRFPHAILVEFSDLGHAGWIQDPARVGTTVVDFLTNKTP